MTLMAAAFALCQLDSVKTRLELTVATVDTAISAIVDDVSDRIAGEDSVGLPTGFLNRHLVSKARLEIYRVPRFAPFISLRGYPIDTTKGVVLRYNNRRTFVGVGTVDTLDYDLDPQNGLLHLHFDAAYEPGWMEVTYTGGLASDQADWLAKYPSMASAAVEQVVHEYQRSKSPGQTVRMRAGTIEVDPDVKWLPNVQSKLTSYRRNNA